MPAQFHFQCQVPVRIADINYGGHVGNDAVLSIIHEARMQYLRHLGYTELEFGGVGMIMADVVIEFKNELFYNETVIASVSVGEISKIGFDIFYALEKQVDGKNMLVAKAKTGMICFNYAKKKIMSVPAIALAKLTN